MKIKGDVKTKPDGTKYLSVKTTTAHLKPQLVKGRFDQLFRNNKQLSKYHNVIAVP